MLLMKMIDKRRLKTNNSFQGFAWNRLFFYLNILNAHARFIFVYFHNKRTKKKNKNEILNR